MGSKNTYYFSHDANAHEDEKIVCLLVEYGPEGYGWWWLLVEILFQQEDCRLDLSKKTAYPYLARMLWCDPQDIEGLIQFLIKVELLQMDGDYVYSPSLNRRNEKLADIKQKRRAAAEARWSKSNDKAPSNPENYKGIQVLNDKWPEFKQEIMASDRYRHIPEDKIEFNRESAINWLKSNNKRKKDYKAFFKNWLNKWIESNPKSQNSNNMVY